MSFYNSFLRELEALYPATAKRVDVRSRVFPQLVCPVALELPSSLMIEAQKIVEAFFALREDQNRANSLRAMAPPLIDPGNASVLMSYDFHVDEAGRLRLIEINTNASMSLMTDLLYRTHGLVNPFLADSVDQDFRKAIVQSFANEFSLAATVSGNQIAKRALREIAIIDEAPETQRLYIEFELYRELFEANGYRARILGPQDVTFANDRLTAEDRVIDLVYNRDTDFYYEDERNRALQRAMMAKAACVTPHPNEYRLLADKERLLELSRPGAIDGLNLANNHKEVIAKTLIRTRDITDFSDHDSLWADRKNWFFKTKNSFGGKAAYRGSSMSRPVFANIVSGPYLAQEYVPAPSVIVETEVYDPESNGNEAVEGRKLIDTFKYDLRFYVYRDTIQIACARLYKGMMTNVQSPGGGVAAINWK